jgi:hypothetical protein
MSDSEALLQADRTPLVYLMRIASLTKAIALMQTKNSIKREVFVSKETHELGRNSVDFFRF